MKNKWSKIKKLNPPKLTFKVKEIREHEKRRRHRYEGRLLFWFSTLKRMIKIRKERIQEIEKEKTEIEKEIQNLQREVEKRSDYQTELREHLEGLQKEMGVYQEFFKNEMEGDFFNKKPSFYIKTQKHKKGYRYYTGRIRYFQWKNQKRREKWIYFGSVSDMNRKYGNDFKGENKTQRVKSILKEKLKDIYYSELFGE